MNALERGSRWTAGLGLVIAAACGSAAPDDSRPAANQDLGAGRSVTVFPVLMGDTPDPEVAQVVGVLLERGGLPQVELAEAAFEPTTGDFEEQAAAFGKAVAERGLQTDYALLAFFEGSGTRGVEEVRGAIVTPDGEVVWTERQRPGDPVFDRMEPDCPMTCCVLLVERLRAPLHLQDPTREDAPEGTLSARLRQESLVPDEAQREAMEERLAALKNRTEPATVLVYPARVGDGWCAASAAKLAELVNDRDLMQATVADAPLTFEVTPARNQQIVLWSAARSIQELAAQTGPDADYLLLADFMISPRTGKALAVHTFLLTADGAWVVVDFQNSHHADFQRIAAESRDECCELSAVRLAEWLGS